jgi:hypothetical protein
VFVPSLDFSTSAILLNLRNNRLQRDNRLHRIRYCKDTAVGVTKDVSYVGSARAC